MVEYSLLEKEYLTIKEFAGLLGVHYNTVLRAIRSGKLISLRINDSKKASYRIPRSELHRIALCDLETMIKKIMQGKNE